MTSREHTTSARGSDRFITLERSCPMLNALFSCPSPLYGPSLSTPPLPHPSTSSRFFFLSFSLYARSLPTHTHTHIHTHTHTQTHTHIHSHTHTHNARPNYVQLSDSLRLLFKRVDLRNPRCVHVCVCVWERERALLGTTVPNGGLGWRPRHGLRITTRYPASPPISCAPISCGSQWWGSILHGEDLPRTLMKGSPAGAVEPVRHRQETLDLHAWRE
jgi:hypothetical protein